MTQTYRPQNILVVDPSEATRGLLKHHLECQGAVVYTAGVVDKIKTIIEGTDHNGMPIDLILVDVHLPETFAFYALKVIQTALGGRHIPILVMSNGYPASGVRQMKQWGVFGYLRKPFQLRMLDAFVAERLTAYCSRFGEPEKVKPAPPQNLERRAQ